MAAVTTDRSIITVMDAPTDRMKRPPKTPTAGGPHRHRAPPAAPVRRLARSSDDRVLAGVAAGIAEYYGIEPLLVRLGFVVASFFGGIGVVAYIVGWIVLPRPESGVPARPRRRDSSCSASGSSRSASRSCPGASGSGSAVARSGPSP